MHRAVLSWDRGETKCGDENYDKALYMLWASRIMCDTPIEGDANPGCTDIATAEEWARHADCLCAPCECPDDTQDCELVPVFTVLEAIAFADLPLTPATDDAYFILSGDNAGSVATWDGAAWQYEAVTAFQLVWATVTNDYWTVGSGGVTGPWFPPPLLLNVTGDFWMAYSNPGALIQGRTIQLQAFGPNGWYDIAEPATESLLGQFLNLAGLPLNQVRWKYIDGDCIYFSASGTFEPPIEPPTDCTIIPSFTVLATVDASAEGTLPEGAYLILTNDFSVTNGWSDHVGEIVNADGSFTEPPTGATIYVAGTQQQYWFLYGSGWAPLFPPLTITQGIGTITVTSDYPAATAEQDRYLLVIGTVNGVDVVLASGTESQLPFTVPGSYGVIENPFATYILAGPCPYNAPVTYDDDTPIAVDFDCSAIQDFTYRYVANQPPDFTNVSFLFTAPPGQGVRLVFIQGGMDPDTVIRAYDGTSDLDPPIPGLTGTFGPNMGVGGLNINGEAYSGNLLLIIDAPINQPLNLQTWLFQVSCLPPEIGPDAFVIIEDKCDEYAFAAVVEVLFMGTILEYALEYTTDGGVTWQVANPSITIEGIYSVGSFPYESEVGIRLVPIDPVSPLNIALLGYYTGSGICPNPCGPEGASKIDAAGDWTERTNVPPGFPSWSTLIISDTTGGAAAAGFQIGEVVEYTPSTGQTVLFTGNPGTYSTSSPLQYWTTNGPGVQPYPLLPTGLLSPTGNTPNNWQISSPSIQQYGMPGNEPIQLQVRNGNGAWIPVHNTTVQQLAFPVAISIAVPFTNARLVLNYDTCGLSSGVEITA